MELNLVGDARSLPPNGDRMIFGTESRQVLLSPCIKYQKSYISRMQIRTQRYGNEEKCPHRHGDVTAANKGAEARTMPATKTLANTIAYILIILAHRRMQMPRSSLRSHANEKSDAVRLHVDT